MGRFLRIGLVRDGQLLEERFVPMGIDVTIGRAPGNTFVVPQADLPKSTLVFKARGTDRHALMFTKPTGRVDLGNGEVATLAEIAQKGMAAQRENLFAFPLPALAFGKFQVGDVTVLFHYKERDLVLTAATVAVASGPQPLMMEAVLSWDGTVLQTKKVDPLRPLVLGPGPLCDLQIPGRVLESRAYSVIAGSDGRFVVDLRNKALSVASYEGKDGKAATNLGETHRITQPFAMSLTMPEGFSLELRYQPALAKVSGSPFDIQDPLPFMSLAGSALFHAAIMLIAFAVAQNLIEPKEVKAERRRELSVMLQEQKADEQERKEEKAAEAKKADKPEAAKKDEPKKEEKVEAKKPEPKRDSVPPPASGGSATPEARRTKLAEGVRQKTFMGALGGEGSASDEAIATGREDKFADAFQDVAGGYAANGGSDDALAPPGPGNGDGTQPGYKTLSKDEKGGGSIDTASVDSGSKGAGEEQAIKVNVRTGSLGSEGGVGKIDDNAVAAVFGRRKGAIKACYEKELRRNQNIKGRITLRFTIGTSGRITSIAATQNTTGDEGIASCIISKVEGWKFDPPTGGAVTFTYPFILEAR